MDFLTFFEKLIHVNSQNSTENHGKLRIYFGLGQHGNGRNPAFCLSRPNPDSTRQAQKGQAVMDLSAPFEKPRQSCHNSGNPRPPQTPFPGGPIGGNTGTPSLQRDRIPPPLGPLCSPGKPVSGLALLLRSLLRGAAPRPPAVRWPRRAAPAGASTSSRTRRPISPSCARPAWAPASPGRCPGGSLPPPLLMWAKSAHINTNSCGKGGGRSKQPSFGGQGEHLVA